MGFCRSCILKRYFVAMYCRMPILFRPIKIGLGKISIVAAPHWVCLDTISHRPASLAPRIRLPKQPSHLSTRSGSHFCLLRPWQSTSVHSMEAVTATGCLVASPDALQRSARCPPQRVPSNLPLARELDVARQFCWTGLLVVCTEQEKPVKAILCSC